MSEPTTGAVAAIIANGHAYDKHVLGNDPDSRHHNGINQFRAPDLGPDLNINSQADLQNYIDDMLSKEGTKGFRDSSGHYVFFNRADNTLLIVNPKDGDLGTIYRPERGAQAWTRLVTEARTSARAVGATINIVDTPEGVQRLATGKKGFLKTIANHPRGSATFNQRSSDLGLQNAPDADAPRPSGGDADAPRPNADPNAPRPNVDPDMPRGARRVVDGLSNVGKRGGTVPGIICGTVAAGTALVFGASPAEAAEIGGETAVPFGGSINGAIQGDGRKVVAETGSEIAGIGGGVLIGGLAAMAPIPGVGVIAIGVAGGVAIGYAGYVAAGRAYDTVAAYNEMNDMIRDLSMPRKIGNSPVPVLSDYQQFQMNIMRFSKDFLNPNNLIGPRPELSEEGTLLNPEDYDWSDPRNLRELNAMLDRAESAEAWRDWESWVDPEPDANKASIRGARREIERFLEELETYHSDVLPFVEMRNRHINSALQLADDIAKTPEDATEAQRLVIRREAFEAYIERQEEIARDTESLPNSTRELREARDTIQLQALQGQASGTFQLMAMAETPGEALPYLAKMNALYEQAQRDAVYAGDAREQFFEGIGMTREEFQNMRHEMFLAHKAEYEVPMERIHVLQREYRSLNVDHNEVNRIKDQMNPESGIPVGRDAVEAQVRGVHRDAHEQRLGQQTEALELAISMPELLYHDIDGQAKANEQRQPLIDDIAKDMAQTHMELARLAETPEDRLAHLKSVKEIYNEHFAGRDDYTFAQFLADANILQDRSDQLAYSGPGESVPQTAEGAFDKLYGDTVAEIDNQSTSTDYLADLRASEQELQNALNNIPGSATDAERVAATRAGLNAYIERQNQIASAAGESLSGNQDQRDLRDDIKGQAYQGVASAYIQLAEMADSPAQAIEYIGKVYDLYYGDRMNQFGSGGGRLAGFRDFNDFLDDLGFDRFGENSFERIASGYHREYLTEVRQAATLIEQAREAYGQIEDHAERLQRQREVLRLTEAMPETLLTRSGCAMGNRFRQSLTDGIAMDMSNTHFKLVQDAETPQQKLAHLQAIKDTYDAHFSGRDDYSFDDFLGDLEAPIAGMLTQDLFDQRYAQAFTSTYEALASDVVENGTAAEQTAARDFIEDLHKYTAGEMSEEDFQQSAVAFYNELKVSEDANVLASAETVGAYLQQQGVDPDAQTEQTAQSVESGNTAQNTMQFT